MPVAAFLKVMDRLPEPTLLVSGDGAVLGANRALARLGVRPLGLTGRSLAEFAAQPPEAVADFIRRCARSGQPLPAALTLLDDGGRSIPCRAEGSVLDPPSGNEPAVVLIRLTPRDNSVSQFLRLNRQIDGLNREIARRQQVEDQLREQREWFAVTLASIGDAVIATDTLGRVTFMNDVAQALTGWDMGEATGRPLEEVFHIIDEDTRDAVEPPVSRCLRDGAIAGPANHTLLISRDGEEHAIEDSVAPIRHNGGHVRGVVLVFHDVGSQRQLERELRRRAEQLAENDRLKNEFLAMLAHELRNPLSAITNAVQLAERSDSAEDQSWCREVVGAQAHHLARMLEDLLDVSRLTRGRIKLRTEPLSLAGIIRAALVSVGPLLEERGHRLIVDLAPGPLPVEGDPTRLEQVIVNLLTNAAKYTDPGGRIVVAAERRDDRVILKVEDNGVGMTPELLARAFDLFAQGDRTIARSEGGLGIGLTLVKTLVDLHGGTVEAASAGPGQGSRVTVTLPVGVGTPATRGQEPDAQPPAAGLERGSGLRILVVDDIHDNVRTLGRLLTLLGHEVHTADDGPSAIDAARRERPDAILLDIGLPGMDGYQVARVLRSEDCGRDTIIVAVSGYGQDSDRLRSTQAGFDDHLVKPVNLDILSALLDRVPRRPHEREA